MELADMCLIGGTFAVNHRFGFLDNAFNSLKFHILSEYLNPHIYDALIKLSMNRFLSTCPYPFFFFQPKIQPSRHLRSKFQIQNGNHFENGSAVPVSIYQSDLPALKINTELPSKGLLPQLPLIEKNLALSFQLPATKISVIG